MAVGDCRRPKARRSCPKRSESCPRNPGPGVQTPARPLAPQESTHVTSIRTKNAIALKYLALRDQLWPGTGAYLWDRSAHKGFATIPKTMPLILQIIDQMTKNTPASSTYFSLWCSTWDNSYVTLSKTKDLAHASGFSGQRAEYVWSTRMKLLQELKFIDIKAGKSGALGHAIIWNPHLAIRWHHEQKTPGLSEASYTALLEWALEMGAKDMTAETPVPWAVRTVAAA